MKAHWPCSLFAPNFLASASLYIIEGQILVIREVRASDDEMRSGELGVRPHSNKVGKNIKWRIRKMRLKSIAVLVVAILLVAGSASAIAIAGAEDAMLLKVGPAGAMAIAGGEDEAGADDVSGGVYWWEDAFDLCCYCPTSDEHRQVKQAIEIIILVGPLLWNRCLSDDQ
jgi:hypothetical protein